MKIYAHSEVPDRVPYLHLGYIATSSYEPPPGLLTGGIALGLAGAFLAGRLRRHPRPNSGLVTHVEFRRSLAGYLGLLAMGGGLTLVGLAFTQGRLVPHSGGLLTLNTARQVQLAIELWRADQETATNPAPVRFEPGVHDLGPFLAALPELHFYLPPSVQTYSTDAWGSPLKLEIGGTTHQPTFTILSAGKDLKFGTADDIQLKPQDRR